jgi:hypothetical protein
MAINTVAKDTYPKGPPIKNIIAIKSATKGKSTKAVIVAVVKNSLTLSKDCNLLTNIPVDDGFAFNLIFKS